MEFDIKHVSDLAQQARSIQVVASEAGHFAVIPEGQQLVSLVEYQQYKPPVEKAAAVVVRDTISFAGYFNRFCDEDSMVFADPDPKSFSFVGIIDYHREKDKEARRRQHTVKLKLEFTKRWLTWFGANKQAKTQEDFAQFIEDNLYDIHQPDGSAYPSPADMLEVSRSLQANSSHQFAQATNLKNGQRVLNYVEQINGQAGPRGEMEIPDKFILSIPVFLNQKPTLVECRLRFRISSGKLSMWFDMLRVDEMLASEFQQAREEVEEQCGRVVILGAA